VLERIRLDIAWRIGPCRVHSWRSLTFWFPFVHLASSFFLEIIHIHWVFWVCEQILGEGAKQRNEERGGRRRAGSLYWQSGPK
jgi:hypothetical protein